MIYYNPVKVTVDVPNLIEVIINMVVRYYGIPNSIIIDCDLLFISQFWSLLYYFVDIKKKLSTSFYPQTDGQTKR